VILWRHRKGESDTAKREGKRSTLREVQKIRGRTGYQYFGGKHLWTGIVKGGLKSANSG